MKTYQSTLVYSLLQIEAYAMALLTDDAETAARLKRQEILGQPVPPTLHVVLDEVVLWREVGNSASLRETPVQGLVPVSPEDVARVCERRETILADALPVEMSKELIKRTAEERWTS